jgi:hypothetical protein
VTGGAGGAVPPARSQPAAGRQPVRAESPIPADATVIPRPSMAVVTVTASVMPCLCSSRLLSTTYVSWPFGVCAADGPMCSPCPGPWAPNAAPMLL